MSNADALHIWIDDVQWEMESRTYAVCGSFYVKLPLPLMIVAVESARHTHTHTRNTDIRQSVLPALTK